jgi:hypothetical protein
MKAKQDVSEIKPAEAGEDEQGTNEERLELMVEFSKSFLPP